MLMLFLPSSMTLRNADKNFKKNITSSHLIKKEKKHNKIEFINKATTVCNLNSKKIENM